MFNIFFLFRLLTASSVVVRVTPHFSSCMPMRQCPLKNSVRVFISDFRRPSIVLVRFRLWHGYVYLEISQLVAFFNFCSACLSVPCLMNSLQVGMGCSFPSQFVCNAVILYVLMSRNRDEYYFVVLGHLVKRSTTFSYCFRVIYTRIQCF